MEQEKSSSKKSFLSKEFWINGDSSQEGNTSTVKKTEVKKSFPNQSSNNETVVSSNVSFENNTTHSNFNSEIDQVILKKVIENYESNFQKINKPGYDFFEYYNGVKKTGLDKPEVYKMAFDMATSFDSKIDKDLLVKQSDEYILQINEMYQNQVNAGEAKKASVIENQKNENQNLTAELENLNQQLETLKIQIQDRQNKLSMVDNKYQPQVQDIEQKLLANDFAKNRMISDLQKVKQGIINNV